MASLDVRVIYVHYLHWLRRETPETLESLAQKYDVSRERIRQLEIRAFEKVKQYTLALAEERGLALPAS